MSIFSWLKKQRLPVYLFATLAVLGIGVSSELGAEGTTYQSSQYVAVQVDNSIPAASYYEGGIESVLSTPETAYFTPNDFSTVQALEERLENANDTFQTMPYFTFTRWAQSPLLPTPPIGFGNIGALVTSAFISLSNLLLTLSAVILMAMGLLLMLLVSLDIIAAFIPTIDWFFFRIATGGELLGLSANGGVAIGTVIGVAVALMLVAIVVRLSPLARSNRRSVMSDIVISGVVIAAFIGMALASYENWRPGSTAAVSGLTDSPNQIPFGQSENSINDVIDITNEDIALPSSISVADPASYTDWSMGNVLARTAQVVDLVTNFFAGIIADITTSISSVNQGDQGIISGSNCYNYVRGMHNIATAMLSDEGSIGGFLNLDKTSVSSIIAYDRMVMTVLYQPAAQAAFGNSTSGAATWCRMWESARGSDPIDQAVISRAGGMYSYALGATEANTARGGEILEASGELASGFSGSDQRSVLAGFFGTTINAPKAATAFKFYWAVCQFRTSESGGNLVLSSSWNGVKSPPTTSTPTADGSTGGIGGATAGDEVTASDCRSIINLGSQSDGFIFSVGPGVSTAMEELSTFAWTPTDIPSANPFDFIFNVSGSANLQEQFAGAPNSEARDFFNAVYGSGSAYVWPAAAVAAVGTILIAVGLLPMQLGALVLQVIAVIALIFMPVLLVAMILPISATRRAFASVIKVFIASKIIQAIFVIFISIMIALTNLINIAFGAVFNSSFAGVANFTGDGTPLGVFIRAIFNAVAIGIAFVGTKKLLQTVFKADVTKLSGAMQVGQNVATQAINGASLREMGFGQFNGLNGNRGMGSRGFELPQMSSGDDDDMRTPPQSSRKDKSTDQPKASDKIKDDVEAAAAAAAAGAAAAGSKSPEVDPASATPQVGTVGDGFEKQVEDRANGDMPTAPVPNDNVQLSDEERRAAADGIEAVREAAGVDEAAVQEEMQRQSTADLESDLAASVASGDVEAQREALGNLGAGAEAMAEGDVAASQTPSAAAKTASYFSGDVEGEESPTERGDKAGEADLAATTLANIENEVRAKQTSFSPEEVAGGPSVTSQFSGVGIAEDGATSGRMPGSEGAILGSGSGGDEAIDAVFSRFDAMGRSIVEATEAQADVIREASQAQVKAVEKNTEKLDTLISAWFPRKK